MSDLDWPGCQHQVFDREAKTMRYCALPLPDDHAGFCTRHTPKSRLDRTEAFLRGVLKRGRKAINRGVLTLKRWVA